jgi:hypothetical protein
MATGSVIVFDQAVVDIHNKIHNLSSDDLRIGFVTTATTPTKTTAAPHWGGTGTTNFATNQVSTAGTSYTGPIALTGEAVSASASIISFSAGKVGPLAQDASGPANIAWGIIYNNTDANKRAIAAVELSAAGTLSLVAGTVEIRWNGTDGVGFVFRTTNT